MKFAQNELRQITEDTWKIVLGEDLQALPRPVMFGEFAEPIAACVQIAGDWPAVVLLCCPTAIAKHAATIMFGARHDVITPEDTQDSLCELIDIIAGNMKGLLSGTSHLSLPNIIAAMNFHLMFPRHILLSQAFFRYADQPLLVMLLGEDKLAAGENNALAPLPQ